LDVLGVFILFQEHLAMHFVVDEAHKIKSLQAGEKQAKLVCTFKSGTAN